MLQNTKGEEIVLHKDQAGIIIHLADKKGFTLPYEDVEKLIKLINNYNPFMGGMKPLYEIGNFMVSPRAGGSIEFKPQWWATENCRKDGIENVLITDKQNFCKELEKTKAFGLQTQGKHAEALKIFERLFQNDQENLELLKGIGYSLYEVKRYADAKAYLDRYVYYAPDKVDAKMTGILTKIQEKLENPYGLI
ncbi:MAG TPA: tetratricopeptide repeat protein [Candidatus Eremiobacteraeota bacterium]|nr:MAG: hypothetical protein BWY64_00568 [bacterium ADurb.Bin363]HPZ09745.1 tetratricopeptide repeat protein [Candidatus Eremiobacteraeota bacterium]